MTLDLDGWSNIHNEPTICASVITEYSQSFLVETIDTSGNKYHTNYLTQLGKQIISRTIKKFGLKVGSFVADNAANMNEMRTELRKSDVPMFASAVAYGCSAHLATLLAHDLDNISARNHVIQIIKHIRNSHAACVTTTRLALHPESFI